ncbi:glycosyltransferase family 2 protein [Shimia sediminis]|uniref:glycosyltransferase family 2 protein n=1 Tax=Shimia sediminis TaxID=2497945 RepID=UPI000F8F0644|nr:glycosyltransferase [Shimia sediminis]
MTHDPVSVVIVSRERPEALLRCLKGLSQQYYPNFETIVVADPTGTEAVNGSAFAGLVKLVEFDEPNISVARNLGIAEAAGEVVAFIDDDAVAEPTWLTHLVAPFVADAEVMAAGGFVRGRNGISFQWKAQSVDAMGRTEDLKVDETRPSVLHPTGRRAIKTEGTNMAFRREVLAEIGGFDPAYHYYLDETDVNLRLAAMGRATAIVPLAEVHHGYLSNASRRGNRAPSDLFQIGASQVVFLRKHCPVEHHETILKDFAKEQRLRALEHMRDGRLEPRDVRRLMSRLTKGYAAGKSRPLGALPRIPRPSEGLRPFPSRAGTAPAVVAGRRWNARGLRRRAAELVAQGQNVSLFLFSRTGLFHRVRFHPDGYWEQTGGIFGKSDRDQPLFRVTGFGNRLKEEKLRLAEQRRLFED